ncbi:unnamed protein product [Sympodiomycopsis kandeliae]
MSYVPSLSTLFRLFTGISVISVSSLAGLLYTYQTKLIYPSNLPPGAREDRTDPSSESLPFEASWLQTPDGETLQAWYIRPDPEKEVRTTTVVMFQANAGNIAHRLPIASILYHQLKVNVVMFSYRGYGRSSGSPQEVGIKIDSQVVLDWVRENLTNHKIVLFGQSLGGAVAIDSAVRNSNLIDALVLENTFLDIPTLIPSVLPPAKYFSFLCKEIWSSKTRLPLLQESTDVKVLFLAGEKDELVPHSHMQQLHALCKADKEWKVFANGTHNDTCLQRGYFPTLASFLHRHLHHETPLSHEALSRGFTGESSSSSSMGKEESRIEKHLQAYEDEDGDAVGSMAPADIVDEEITEIETEGVRFAQRAGNSRHQDDEKITEIESEDLRGAQEIQDSKYREGSQTKSSPPSSSYKLPVAPLITRNLDYVMNPQNLPYLPLKFLREECLTSSIPFPIDYAAQDIQLLPIVSAEDLHARIRKTIPIQSLQWEHTTQLMQALALVVASPADQTASSAENESVSNAQHRLLLASCYVALDQLHKARTVLEVAREVIRPAKKSQQTATDAQTSKTVARQVLVALSNVAALQGNQDTDAKRFLKWWYNAGIAAQKHGNE